MAVRDGRAARLRRAPRGRALALVALYLGATVLATWPAARLTGGFAAADGLPEGGDEPPAGDHLQLAYRLWLVGHQLSRGEAPWRDPYSFQPLVEPQLSLAGWPFGLPFWPLEAAFGPVTAWNLLVLGTTVAAGLVTYGWLRALALTPLAAAVGGLAFALAPYRLAQGGWHLLGWIALFVPLALLGVERARSATTTRGSHAWGALAAASVVTIPLAGQLHLALGAIPFLLAYALVRGGRLAVAWTVVGAFAAIGVGLALRYTVVAGSAEAADRSLGDVDRFSAEWSDFVDRGHRGASEEFVFVGWLTPVLGLAGLVVLARGRRGLAAVLAVAAVVPVLLALGTNLPLYEAVWDAVPPLRFARVPERLLPIAVLALAALAAFAVARRPLLAVAALVLVTADLAVLPLAPAADDPGNRAYAALQDTSGRYVDVPVLAPGDHRGAVYDYYALQARRERPTGYSTLAPEEAVQFARRFDVAELARVGVDAVVLHRGASPADERAFLDAGFRRVATDGSLELYTR